MPFKVWGFEAARLYLPGRKILKVWKPDLTLERTQAGCSGSHGQWFKTRQSLSQWSNDPSHPGETGELKYRNQSLLLLFSGL